jgi:hypothetical protein
MTEELTNVGLTATFIISIEDVTDAVKQDASPSLTERERQSFIDKNILKIRETKKKESYQDILICPFFLKVINIICLSLKPTKMFVL